MCEMRIGVLNVPFILLGQKLENFIFIITQLAIDHIVYDQK